MGSLYRVSPKVKYHHALKKALNKEGKRGKGENKVKKSTKGERDNSHKATISYLGAKFLVLFFFHSYSTPVLLLISNL